MSSFIKAITISFIFVPNIVHSQIKVDTLSAVSVKVFEETKAGRIVEKTVIDYKIKTVEVADTNFYVPQIILRDSNLKARAFKIMEDTSKKEDTLLCSDSHVKIPLYMFWQGSKDSCYECVWKNKAWNVGKNKKVFSTSGCFEELFWLKFIGCFAVMLFVGRISFFSVKQHQESVGGHIFFILLAGFLLPTFFIFFGFNMTSFNYFATVYWLKIGIINSIIGFTGGYIIWSLYPKQILKTPQNYSSNAYSKE